MKVLIIQLQQLISGQSCSCKLPFILYPTLQAWIILLQIILFVDISIVLLKYKGSLKKKVK